MKRIRKWAAVTAVALALMVAPAIPASAAGISLGHVYGDINYQREVYPYNWGVNNWQGPCDGDGYTVYLWSNAVSSLTTYGNNCNWATGYYRKQNLFSYSWVFCGSFPLPAASIGGCSDHLDKMKVIFRTGHMKVTG